MGDAPENVSELLRKGLTGDRNGKILRFLLNVLSGTPTIGGVFSASASAWSEANQQRTIELVAQFATLTDERITRLEKSLVAKNDPHHVVAGYIAFNPNSGFPDIIDSSGMTSLTDGGGALEFDIAFDHDFRNYIFNYYGSGNIVLKEVHETVGGIRVSFEEPCPDRVTIVFFDQRTNSQMEADG